MKANSAQACRRARKVVLQPIVTLVLLVLLCAAYKMPLKMSVVVALQSWPLCVPWHLAQRAASGQKLERPKLAALPAPILG